MYHDNLLADIDYALCVMQKTDVCKIPDIANNINNFVFML